MIALLFWLAVGGAIVDWRYMRAGGPRPSRDDRRYLLIAVVFVVGVLGLLAILGASARSVGEALSLNLTLIEMRRFLPQPRGQGFPPLRRRDRTAPERQRRDGFVDHLQSVPSSSG